MPPGYNPSTPAAQVALAELKMRDETSSVRDFPPSVWLWGLVLLLLAVACRGVPGPFAPPARPTPVSTATRTIEMTLWHSETGIAKTKLEELAVEFHSNYPDLKVKPEQMGNEAELLNQLIAALASNSAPALALVDRRSVHQLVRQDGITNLDKLMQDGVLGLPEDERADFFTGMLDAGVLNDPKRTRTLPTPTPPPPTEEPPNDRLIELDRLARTTPTPTPGPLVVPIPLTCAIPFDTSALVLYLNLDLLRARGLEKPSTWSELSRVAREVTRGENYGWAFYPSAAVWEGMLVSSGGQLVDSTGRRTLLAQEAGLQAAGVISEVLRSGAGRWFETAAQARADFIAGRAAFLIDSTAELEALTRQTNAATRPFRLGMANLPLGTNTRPVTLLFSRGWVIFRTDSERARAAWFFVRWITATRQTAAWARATGALPLRASAMPLLQDDERVRRLQDTFGPVIPLFVPRHSSRYASRIDALLEDLMRQIAASKEVNLQAMLEATAARLDPLLAAP